MNTSIETSVPPARGRPNVERRNWSTPLLLLMLIGALSVLWLAGVLPRQANLHKLEKAAAALTRTYTVAVASPGETESELVLPSTVEALQETPLYPRVNGYIRRISADIGSPVKAGDVLAEIETPELDQQVAQARAALDQAKANLHLAQVSYGRWQELQKSRIVAPQEVDERKGTLDARKADLAAADANVQRLEKMQSYQRITAPFSGTVTKRFVEVGQLVTGDLNDSSRVLFQLQHTDSLRAFVHVPQSAFRSVSTGQNVALSFRELPGRTFTGKVIRTAGALDGTTRTLRTEVHVSNESGELLPGLYAEVRFTLQRNQPPVTVPARALIVQSAGPQIAIVDENNRVTLNPVSIARDLGKTVELATGIEAGTRFIINPTDTLRDGMTVNVETVESTKVASK